MGGLKFANPLKSKTSEKPLLHITIIIILLYIYIYIESQKFYKMYIKNSTQNYISKV